MNAHGHKNNNTEVLINLSGTAGDHITSLHLLWATADFHAVALDTCL